MRRKPTKIAKLIKNYWFFSKIIYNIDCKSLCRISSEIEVNEFVNYARLVVMNI
jgi:hypothetical protein